VFLGPAERRCGCVACPKDRILLKMIFKRSFGPGSGGRRRMESAKWQDSPGILKGDFGECYSKDQFWKATGAEPPLFGTRIAPNIPTSGVKNCQGLNFGPRIITKFADADSRQLYFKGAEWKNRDSRHSGGYVDIKCRLWKQVFCFTPVFSTLPGQSPSRSCAVTKRLSFVSAEIQATRYQRYKLYKTTKEACVIPGLKKLQEEVNGLCHFAALAA